MKGGGDAVSAARAVLQTGEYDFAWNLQVEDEILKRLEKGGKGRVVITPGGGIEHIQLNFTDPWTEVDGERSSIKTKHPTLSRSGGAPGAGAADRPGFDGEIHLRPHRRGHRQLHQQSRTLPFEHDEVEFNVEKATALLEKAGWKPGSDGIREKDGKKLKYVYQTSINQPRQKTQAIVKQACQKAGIEIEIKSVVASVFFSSDVANPDTYPHFFADLQIYNNGPNAARPGRLDAPVLLVGGRHQGEQWQGRNITRWQNQEYDDIHKAATGRARPDQARRAADQDERPGREQSGRDPAGHAARRRRRQQQAGERAERLGQQHLGSRQLVHRELRDAA